MPPSATTRRCFLTAATALAAAPAWGQSIRMRVRIDTDKGAILVELADDKAPITVANFLRYVDSHRWDGAVFYRASRAPNAPEVGFIQAGIKDGAKLYPPIAHESTAQTGLKHITGALSMPRFAPGTAQAEFTICCSDSPYMDADPNLPGDNLGYAVFGQVIEGMEAVRLIHDLPTGGPAQNPVMQGEMLNPPVVIRSAQRA